MLPNSLNPTSATSFFIDFFSFVFLIWFLIAVIAVDVKQTVQVDKDLTIRGYYAGHVRLLNFTYKLHS